MALIPWTQCPAVYVGVQCMLHIRHHPKLHRAWNAQGHVEWVGP